MHQHVVDHPAGHVAQPLADPDGAVGRRARRPAGAHRRHPAHAWSAPAAAVEVAAGQLHAAPAQRVVALAGRVSGGGPRCAPACAPSRRPSGVPRTSLIQPGMNTMTVSPSRRALTMRRRRVTAPDLDDRGVRHRPSLGPGPARPAGRSRPTVVHRPSGLWTTATRSAAAACTIEPCPPTTTPPTRPCPRVLRLPPHRSVLRLGRRMPGCSGSTRPPRSPSTDCHRRWPRCSTSWPGRCRPPRSSPGRCGARRRRGRRPSSCCAELVGGRRAGRRRRRASGASPARAESTVVVSGGGPLAVGVVLGLAHGRRRRGARRVTSGTVLAGDLGTGHVDADRGRDRGSPPPRPRCAGLRPGAGTGAAAAAAGARSRRAGRRAGPRSGTGRAAARPRHRPPAGPDARRHRRGRSARAARPHRLPGLPRAAPRRPRPRAGPPSPPSWSGGPGRADPAGVAATAALATAQALAALDSTRGGGGPAPDAGDHARARRRRGHDRPAGLGARTPTAGAAPSRPCGTVATAGDDARTRRARGRQSKEWTDNHEPLHRHRDAEVTDVTDIPRRTAARTAKLASLPLGVAGRAAAGWGRRLAGGDGEEISAQLMAKSAEQLFAVLGELKGGAMKFGQALSVFEAAIPDEYAAPFRESLVKLQTAAPADAGRRRAPDARRAVRPRLARPASASSTRRPPPRRASARSTARCGATGARSRSRCSTRAPRRRCAPTCASCRG